MAEEKKEWRRCHYELSFQWKGAEDPTPKQVRNIIRMTLGAENFERDPTAGVGVGLAAGVVLLRMPDGELVAERKE